MITFEKAQKIADEYAATLILPRGNSRPVAIDKTKTIERAWGWFFVAQYQDYLEKRSSSRLLLPYCLAVFKSDGSMVPAEKEFARDTEEDACVEFEAEYFTQEHHAHLFTQAHYDYLVLKSIREGNIAELLRVIQQGFDLNKIIWDGSTPLSWAVESRKVDVIHLLMKHGADVNVQNAGGYTALMNAAGFTDPELVRILLGYGADPNLKNANGEMAIDIAGPGEAHTHPGKIKAMLLGTHNLPIFFQNSYTRIIETRRRICRNKKLP